MRTFILTLTLSLSLLTNAQTWTTITRPQLGSPFPYMYAGGASLGTRYFKINPYDNSIWFSYSNKIQRITNDGHYQVYDTSNTESLQFDSKIYDFAFTSDFSFVMDGQYGLHQFNESNWTLAIPFDKGLNLAYDNDTVWCTRTNENYMKWYGGFNSQGNYTGSRKAISKNGIFWSGAGTSGLVLLKNDIQYGYSPDTCKLMDWGNYDFKFCRNTDSMYISNAAGLAIADGEHFVDSICVTNSTNMPSGIIVEFEFDANDNIWALFGNEFYRVSSLAFLNTSTKVWSNFYDANNSPIFFNNNVKVSLEIDTLGNVWVIDNTKLNVLDFGNAPTWLGVQENKNDVFMNVYPNPTKNNITVQCKESGIVRLLNLQGEVLSQQTIEQTTQISLEDLSSGTYLIELTTEQGKAVKQVVKQ